MTRLIPLCRSEDVPEGESRGFDPHGEGRDSMFLVRRDGRLYGWLNACPHVAGASMAWRKDRYLNSQGTYITCYAHGALFEIATGVCIQGPCPGKRLQQLTVREDTEGTVMFESRCS
ncbi:Rieske 2Fe-2S domain-containing protein [Marinobacterium sp. D7]|uniref:Rieske (2Fe-2S) protein n=1 Tax=Marinobacterium ramblicola TaxID=2849041 RepID=UPI001C2DB13E|nr:Rieske 2Fe-2S domain-containing protein [Marinobacterium ramblicola]